MCVTIAPLSVTLDTYNLRSLPWVWLLVTAGWLADRLAGICTYFLTPRRKILFLTAQHHAAVFTGEGRGGGRHEIFYFTTQQRLCRILSAIKRQKLRRTRERVVAVDVMHDPKPVVPKGPGVTHAGQHFLSLRTLCEKQMEGVDLGGREG